MTLLQPTSGFLVPDGTTVFPFLNSNDVNSGLPPGLLDDFSLAIGEIDPDSASKIHVHPLVTQVTMVLDGRLEVRLRNPDDAQPRTIQVNRHEAVLVRPGTFLQLVNPSRFPCRTLYVAGPAYVFEPDEAGRPRYDDALTLEESWEELAQLDWMPPALTAADEMHVQREAALRRIHAQYRSRH